jgi:hypothetical protein
MILKSLTTEGLISPLAIIVASLLVGWFTKKVVIVYLAKLATRTKWKLDDVVIASLSRSVILWSL